LLRNRTAHGGILAEGAGVIKHGEKGKGIMSRWYPQTIARRISSIGYVADRIRFIHGDAFTVMADFKDTDGAAFFIDPPYTAGGKRAGSRLYTHSEVDHERLFALCKSLRGDFLMTYDNAEEVRALAVRHGFETCPVAMNNTHHAEMTELLIGRDLRWTEERFVVHERPAPYGVATRHRHKPRASAGPSSGQGRRDRKPSRRGAPKSRRTKREARTTRR
jgi:DNA adenine methylase